MMDLLELAERCEKATGGDALELINLHCDICHALGIDSCEPEAPFTVSLDAAMTLVGDGCFECGNLEGAWARVIDGSKNGFFAEAATPALALCAAALRARSGEQHNG